MIENPLDILKNVPIFGGLPDETLRAILLSKHCRQRKLLRDEPIWSMGDKATSFFFILEGAVDIYLIKRVDYINERKVHLNTIKKHKCFGMDELLPGSNIIRENYAKALTDCKVFEMEQPIVAKFLKKGGVGATLDMTDDEIMDFIRGHRLFQEMPEYLVCMHNSWSEVVDYTPGDIIFREGDPADCLYIVLGGIVEIFIMDDDGRLHVLTKISYGKYFGEQAVLPGKAQGTRSAYARSDGAVKLLKITKERFHEILKNDKELLESLFMLGQQQKAHKQKVISNN